MAKPSLELRVEQIAAAGHLPHQEQPDVVNTIRVDWLRENSGSNSGDR